MSTCLWFWFVELLTRNVCALQLAGLDGQVVSNSDQTFSYNVNDRYSIGVGLVGC